MKITSRFGASSDDGALHRCPTFMREPCAAARVTLIGAAVFIPVWATTKTGKVIAIIWLSQWFASRSMETRQTGRKRASPALFYPLASVFKLLLLLAARTGGKRERSRQSASRDVKWQATRAGQVFQRDEPPQTPKAVR